MTTEMTIIPAASPELQKIVSQIDNKIESAKHLILDAYELAIDEGFTPQQAKKYLYDNIKAFSKRTIREYLPEEAKDETPDNFKQPAEVLPQKNQPDDVKEPKSGSLDSPKEEQIENATPDIDLLQYERDHAIEQRDQALTMNKELMSQMDRLKREKTVVEKVKSTGFIVDGIQFPEEETDKMHRFLIKHNVSYHTLPGIIREFLSNDLVNGKFHLWIQKAEMTK